MALQTDGSIVAALAVAIWISGVRTEASRWLDSTRAGDLDSKALASSGRIEENLGDLIDTASDVAIASDGKVVVSGASCGDGRLHDW